MRIEIWSDVVCPWCFIGKRRLEQALAEFPHREEVEVEYRSFELDPTAPETATESTVEALARKWGTDVTGAREAMARGDAVAAEVGLHFRHHDAPRARTVDAHRLLHLAKDHGLQAELKEALLTAYFLRGESMGDHDVLRKAAVEVGLDAGRVDDVLAGKEYADAVLADIDLARAFGATGVPFYVVDRKYGISGAQPTEVFTQVLERAWEEAHPQLDLVASESGGADLCGPDGCAI
jgi:predicted DsbA family dithiol-disulfide isomerase